MFAKAGLGLVGLGAMGIGGAAIAKPEWFGIEKGMPTYKALSEETNHSQNYTNGKLGNKYGRYLVSSEKESEGWWKWAFKRWEENKPDSGKFGKGEVKGWYSSDTANEGSKSLNQICKEAYGKTDGDFQTSGGATDHAKFNKDEVWKFCSEGRTQPQTISDFNTGSNQETYTGDNAIGGLTPEKEKLLSINSSSNEWVWDLKNKDFQSATNLDQGYFQTEKNKNPRRHIKDICKEAYGNPEKQDAGADKLTKDEVVKHCSLGGEIEY